MSVLPKLDFLHPNLDKLALIRAHTRSSRIRAFVDYLMGIHPLRALPSRRDFDPMAIPKLLQGLVLVSVEHAQDRTRFFTRVVGDDVVDAAPVRFSHRYLDEFSDEVGGAGEIIHSRMAVLRTGMSFLNQSRPMVPVAYQMRAVEYVHCPLASDGVTIDQIVSCFHYQAETEPALEGVRAAVYHRSDRLE